MFNWKIVPRSLLVISQNKWDNSKWYTHISVPHGKLDKLLSVQPHNIWRKCLSSPKIQKYFEIFFCCSKQELFVQKYFSLILSKFFFRFFILSRIDRSRYMKARGNQWELKEIWLLRTEWIPLKADLQKSFRMGWLTEILSVSVSVSLIIYYESVADCEKFKVGIMQLRLSVQHNRPKSWLCPLDATTGQEILLSIFFTVLWV